MEEGPPHQAFVDDHCHDCNEFEKGTTTGWNVKLRSEKVWLKNQMKNLKRTLFSLSKLLNMQSKNA